MGINEFVKIGDSIKELRKKQGYTQAVFADKIGMPRATYANYEANSREPGTEALKKICDGLNIELDKLIYYNAENVRFERMRQEIQEEIATLGLFEKFGFKFQQANEDGDCYVTDTNGREEFLSHDEVVMFSNRLVKELKDFAIFKFRQIMDDIINHEDDDNGED